MRSARLLLAAGLLVGGLGGAAVLGVAADPAPVGEPTPAMTATPTTTPTAAPTAGSGTAAPAPRDPAPATAEADASASPSARARIVSAGTGRLAVVAGGSGRSGTGPVHRYRVEVEGGLGVDARAFAAEVDRVLADPRSWGAGGRASFQRVDAGPVRFRVVLASPRTTDRLCRPYDTQSRYSCGLLDRAVINSGRWLGGARSYDGRLADYRRYVVNHEVGHALDHRHEPCPGRGRRAPVMLQQTIGLRGCRANPWPYPSS